MDTLSFTEPACIRALTVPAAPMSRHQFEHYQSILGEAKDVRLMDLTRNPGLFNPQAYPQGRLVYHLTAEDDAGTLFLHDFEPFRKTFVVIGILQGEKAQGEDADFLRACVAGLRRAHPGAVTHVLLIFDVPSGWHTKVDGVYGVEGSGSNLPQVMCRISSKFLAEFTGYASAYEHVTPRSPGAITGAQPQSRRRISGALELKTEKIARYRARGRRMKIYGDFYLLAGNLKQALANYCEVAYYLNAANDDLWLASALDGLAVCVLLLAFLGVGFQLPGFVTAILDGSAGDSGGRSPFASPFASPVSSPRPSLQLPAAIASSIQVASSVQLAPLPLSSIHELIGRICGCAFRWYDSAVATDDHVPQLVISESHARYAGLCAQIWREKELDRMVMQRVVYGSPAEGAGASASADSARTTCASCAGVTSALPHIFSTRFSQLSVSEQCRLYDFCITLCAQLGMGRKKELLVGALMKLTLAHDLRVHHDDADLQRNILDPHCLVYGICPGAHPSISGPPNALQKRALWDTFRFAQAAGCAAAVTKYGSTLLADFYPLLTDEEQRAVYIRVRAGEMGASEGFNWSAPALIAHAPALTSPTLNSPALTLSLPTSPVSSGALGNLSSPLQSSSSVVASPTFPTFPSSTLQYWDSHMLQSVTLDEKLVQNELGAGALVLRNPFAFDIEVAHLSLCTQDDFPLEMRISSRRHYADAQRAQPVVVKAHSRQTVPVFVTARAAGDIVVCGLEATVCGCQQAVYRVEGSVSVGETSEDCVGRCECKKCKRSTAARLAEDGSADDSACAKEECANEDCANKTCASGTTTSAYTTWKIHVVREQPQLQVEHIGLDNKWVLLLEGECKRFDIVLRNSSKVGINSMSSTFGDSTLGPLGELLKNKKLPPNEVYEIEYYLLRKKPFKILNKERMQEVPGESSFRLEMEIWGKRGVKRAELTLEYAHMVDGGGESAGSESAGGAGKRAGECARAKKLPDPDATFRRTLSIPVNVTVYPSVELVGCDIIPLSSHTEISENNKGDCWQYLARVTGQSADTTMGDFCLLALDFLNSWTEQMDLRIQCLRTSSGDPGFEEQNDPISPVPGDAFETRLSLGSKKTARVLIPVQRMNFTEEELGRRIPSLRNKQFIYDGKTPAAEQRFIKHAFWLRRELLRRLRACWRIPGDVDNSVYAGRSGTVDLRSIRFSSKMVGILEEGRIDIALALETSAGEAAQGSVALNRFYTVRIRVENRGGSAVFGMIRHIPVCKSSRMPVERRILVNGVLQYGIGEKLAPGETREYRLGVVFLEKGEYEWGVLFDEMSDGSDGAVEIKGQHLQREQLRFEVGDGEDEDE